MGGTEGEDDPFSGIVFDEAFIEAAKKRESPAEARAARAYREAALQARLRTERSQLPKRKRRRGPGLKWRFGLWWQRVPAPARTVMTLGVVFALLWATGSTWFRDSTPQWLSGDPVLGVVTTEERPSPTAAESAEPLGEPLPVPPGGGDHAFLATQPDTGGPVAYDPCRPISVVVNDRTAPNGAEGLVEEALTEMSAITGLSFNVEGPTDEPMTEGRPAFQRDRYGDRWAPVLIAWSDPAEVPALDGNVAGIGGSTPVFATPEGPSVYVSGIVALDGPAFTEILGYEDGYRSAKSVVLHELGHLVGLDHSEDPGQLMHGEGHPGIFEHQAGDLEGLARLGRGACVGEL